MVRSTRLAVLAAVLLLGATSATFATPTTQASDEPTAAQKSDSAPEAAEGESLGHRYQLGFGVRAGTGFRVIFPYNSENCGEVGKSVCTGRYPVWLELSPSFGLTDALELLVDVRLFFEKPDFTDAAGILFAPGVKYYTDAESMLKFYLTGQVVFESQEQAEGSGLNSFDLGLRSALGLQVDLLRYVGVYAQVGLIFGFVRWFSFLADFSGGLQVRY